MQEEIINIVKKLYNRKAPGIDGINNSMLKHVPIIYAANFSNLINAIFKYMYFSKIRKTAVVIPISKPGADASFAQNYHPISLIPIFSKLTKYIFSSRFNAFLDKNNIIIQ